MKREYLTTAQGAMLLNEMGIDAFLLFTIQELNDYITTYQIAGIDNAAALLIQSECQSNPGLSEDLKIDPYTNQIFATEAEGTDFENGIIYFDITADVGKKKPKHLGTAVAIDYYNCVQTIVEADMLEEDQALTVDEVSHPVEEEILEPEIETIEEQHPEFVEEVVEEVEEIPQGPTPGELALAAQQEELRRQQANVAQETARQEAELAKQREELEKQRLMMIQAAQAQHEEIARQKEIQKQREEIARQKEILRNQQMYGNTIPLNIDYNEIYADEIESDLPEADIKYYENKNPFLNKVHYAKTHGYEGRKEYELYDAKREVPVEFKKIDYVEDYNNLSMPQGPIDIVIEDIDSIGNSGYVPYPFGPLKRPPVPYDLWRLIKDKKNLK